MGGFLWQAGVIPSPWNPQNSGLRWANRRRFTARSGESLIGLISLVSATSRMRAGRNQNLQRLAPLHLRQRPHLREHLGRQLAVDLDQRDGVAARRFAADMEGRDVDPGLAERGGEACR